MLSCSLRSCAFILLISSLSTDLVAWAQEKAAAAPETHAVKAWYAFYHKEAEQVYRFTLQPAEVDLKLDPKPILRWTNPLEEGDIHGVVYVWRDSGRPVVIGQLFSYLNGQGGRVYCHAMHSLARKDQQLTGSRNGKVFWTPDSPGVSMQDVPDAPAPAATRGTRLLQMKDISRRFTAFTEEATRGKRILRLLTTPLDRYPESNPGGPDGALFSFVVGNDPEVILLLEHNGQMAEQATWQYGLILSTRSTSVAQLDEREIWRHDSSGKNPSDPRSGYLSVHGIATLPLTPPE